MTSKNGIATCGATYVEWYFLHSLFNLYSTAYLQEFIYFYQTSCNVFVPEASLLALVSSSSVVEMMLIKPQLLFHLYYRNGFGKDVVKVTELSN